MTEIEYLLISLAEECAEVQQATSKLLRFGPNDRYPNDTAKTTLDKLQDEMVDLIALVEMLEERGVKIRRMDMSMIAGIAAKKKKVAGYMVYARARGTLGNDDKNVTDELRQAAADYVHNILSQNVAGAGELSVQADESFKLLRADVKKACSKDSSSTPGDTTPNTGAPTST